MSSVSFGLLLSLLAGLSTGVGSAAAYFMRSPGAGQMSLALGFSAGVMLYIAFGELLRAAIDQVGFLTANSTFFIGIVFIAAIDILIPHEYKQETADPSRQPGEDGERESREVPQSASAGQQRPSRLMRTGVLVALGIAIHNFPEGLAVFSSVATGDLAFGVVVAVAVAVHNIPEGISVSVPIAQATGDRRLAFLYSFASGLAEPLGAVVGYALLFSFLTPTVRYSLLAFAAGIMVYISLDELLPAAHRYGKEHFVIMGVLGGMLVVATSIFLMR